MSHCHPSAPPFSLQGRGRSSAASCTGAASGARLPTARRVPRVQVRRCEAGMPLSFFPVEPFAMDGWQLSTHLTNPCLSLAASFCVSHGGGKRCQAPEGCTKSAVGPGFKCVAHGEVVDHQTPVVDPAVLKPPPFAFCLCVALVLGSSSSVALALEAQPLSPRLPCSRDAAAVPALNALLLSALPCLYATRGWQAVHGARADPVLQRRTARADPEVQGSRRRPALHRARLQQAVSVHGARRHALRCFWLRPDGDAWAPEEVQVRLPRSPVSEWHLTHEARGRQGRASRSERESGGTAT